LIASHESATPDHLSGRESPQLFKGKAIALRKNGGSASSSWKGKGIATKDIIRKLRLNNLGLASNSTVVLREPTSRRGSSLIALPGAQEILFNGSDSFPSTAESSKASILPDDSTRKTSVDSRFSILTKESARRRFSRRHPWTRSSPEGGALGTIEESGADQVQPTIETVERASAAKIALEVYFHELLNIPDKRGGRRHILENHLYYSPHLSPDQKQAIRGAFCNQETWHLREQRVMKAQSLLSSCDSAHNSYIDNYEPLKILGKGSFGVVRLVRERSAPEHTFSGQVYAMKVIRKADMLRSSQEGHLRAERDFLVASESSA
jgi:protein-serine/threonine kinase